jgi:hypothetical protein
MDENGLDDLGPAFPFFGVADDDVDDISREAALGGQDGPGDRVAGVLAGQALAKAALAVGLDLDELADVMEQPRVKAVEVDGIGSR